MAKGRLGENTRGTIGITYAKIMTRKLRRCSMDSTIK